MLLDANILVYASNEDAPQHDASKTVLQASLDGRIQASLVPQILLEFYATITNPRRVLRALGPSAAWSIIDGLRRQLPVLAVRSETLDILAQLLPHQQPQAQGIYDLFLVAQMQSHGIRTICTYDLQGFPRIPGFEAITPEEVISRFRLDAVGT